MSRKKQNLIGCHLPFGYPLLFGYHLLFGHHLKARISQVDMVGKGIPIESQLGPYRLNLFLLNVLGSVQQKQKPGISLCPIPYSIYCASAHFRHWLRGQICPGLGCRQWCSFRGVSFCCLHNMRLRALEVEPQ